MIKKISIYSGGILSTRHPQDDRKRYSDTLNSQVRPVGRCEGREVDLRPDISDP